MGKRLIHDYQFNSDSNKITFNEIITQDRFLLITNTTDGENLYSFNDFSAGINNISFDYDNTQTTVELRKNTSAMADSNALQIFIEGEASTVELHETYVDPVAKIRISQPENLIDTDFEYGLQSTKWETLELVKNIPTFFSRNGDIDLAATAIEVTNGADAVKVTCSEEHGLSRGTPILVQGTRSPLANGGFVVTSVLDEYTFQYKAKGIFTTTANIFDTYTLIFVANIYQGTEFDLTGISAVTTNETAQSNLVVKTVYPTNFVEGTSFFLTNSFAKANLTFAGDSTAVDPANAVIISKTSGINSTATGETGNDWTYGVVQPYAWRPQTFEAVGAFQSNNIRPVFFNEEDITIGGANNSEITFAEPHGLTASRSVGFLGFGKYTVGEGATAISGITDGGNAYGERHFFYRVINSTTIQLLNYNTSSTNTFYTINLGSTGTNGITKSCMMFGFGPIYYVRTAGYFYASSNNTFYTLNESSVKTYRDVFSSASRWMFSVNAFNSLFDSYLSNENPRLEYLTKTASSGSDQLLFNYLDITNTFNNYWIYRFGIGNTSTLYRSTTNYQYDGTPDTNDYAGIYGLITPMELSPTGNSIYIANHGFETGNIVTVAAAAGTLPTGLTAGSTYKVVKINDNRMAFQTTGGVDVNFTSSGSTDLQINVTGIQLNLQNDTIYIPNNTVSNGDEVTYTNNGATDIPGLTSGETYFIYEKTSDRFKLATTKSGLSDSAGKTIIVDQHNPRNRGPRIPTNADYIYSDADTLVSGEIVKAQQITGSTTSGITEGAHYFITKNINNIRLYPTDSDRVAATNQILLTQTDPGTFSLQKSTLVDITAFDSGNHSILANFVGAADGVYNLDSSYESDGQSIFTLSNVGQVLRRTQEITQANDVDLYYNAINLENHGYITGNSLEYTTTGTPIGGLSNDTLYYAKRVSKDWFRVAANEIDALDSASVYISFDSVGSGTGTIKGTSIVGETSGSGTIAITENSNVIAGTNTTFSSIFNVGDPFYIYLASTPVQDSASLVSAGADELTIQDSISRYGNGTSITLSGSSAPGGTTLGQRYYVSNNAGSTIKLHNNPTDAQANGDGSYGNNPIDITSSGISIIVNRQDTIGSTIEKSIDYVNSPTKLQLTDNITDSSAIDLNYAVNSKLLIRADGFALHRPYDGGVELIPSTNPDSKMIRQTRKYFRYQSGKGIQVSFAVNFKPTVDIDLLSRSGSTGTITTRYPHRVNITDSSDELDIVVKNATNGEDYWNGTHRVQTIVDDYSFNVDLGGTPADETAKGLVTYYVDGWRNCALRCGLFDDQNGLFFEFNGEELFCAVRSSTQQISGFSSVQFGNGNIRGTGTKFTEQLYVGEEVVIKGQTYVITKISSDSLFHVLPSYRGSTADNVIITKTIDRKIPQSEWNIDKCDGQGRHGFRLDLSRIQMAYIDYSWYGAGKVRFGFKDQHGTVRYVHEFVHGNFQTEAYMRSGNMPARYELKSTGKPTYVPALAHWGTSVIMDGRFDDDKAYVFTANSLTTTLLGTAGADSAGDVVIDASGQIEEDDYYYVNIGGAVRTAGYAIRLSSDNSQYNSFTAGMDVATTNNTLLTGTQLANPISGDITPNQPYLPQVYSYRSDNSNRIQYSTGAYRSLLVVDKKPSTTGSDTYSVTVQAADTTTTATSSGNVNVSKDIPIISIRLAPSVDTNTPGNLGEREIINRMQLILSEVDILTTHGLEVELRVNGQIDNNDWKRVENPSLSQLIYHGSADEITGGTVVFSFNAEGSQAAARAAVLTAKALGDVATLGNSILGGDAVFPDGPDILTVVGRLKEDPSTVTTDNPLSVQGRISWSESQA